MNLSTLEGFQNTAAAVLVGQMLGEPKHLTGGRPFAVLPQETTVKDLEFLLETPTAKRGKVTVTELDSFIRYTKEFGESGTRIFADIKPDAATFVSILDYHEAGKDGGPRWGRHRVTFDCIKTVEWNRWRSNDAKWLSQVDFAAFIEDNLAEIVEPSGATMLEIAKTLEAKSAVDFKSGVRLDNGDHQIKFTVETKAAAGQNGDLTIPSEFALGIAPFNGGLAYKVKARLRYRIEDGHLKLRYELIQPHKVIEAVCKDMLAAIHAETDQTPFAGPAPQIPEGAQ